MHEVTCLSTTGLLEKCLHLDSTSTHAKRDHATHANSYRYIGQFLAGQYGSDDPNAPHNMGTRRWLGSIEPRCEVSDRDGNIQDIKFFAKECLRHRYDDYGRARKNVAYRGTLAPPDEVQIALRDLALRVPTCIDKLFEDLFVFLRELLRKLFPGVPVLVAFHISTGRPHLEWCVPKYRKSNEKARVGVELDSKKWSIVHSKAIISPSVEVPSNLPKLNSQIVRGFFRYVIQRYKATIRLAGLTTISPPEILAARQFFIDLQMASLLDGAASKNRKRAAEAKREMIRHKIRQRNLELEIKLFKDERTAPRRAASTAALALLKALHVEQITPARTR